MTPPNTNVAGTLVIYTNECDNQKYRRNPAKHSLKRDELKRMPSVLNIQIALFISCTRFFHTLAVVLIPFSFEYNASFIPFQQL